MIQFLRYQQNLKMRRYGILRILKNSIFGVVTLSLQQMMSFAAK